VLGDFPTHERLIRDLVEASGCVAIHVEYSRSPEAKYPTALNQCYAALKWVSEHGKEINVDGKRLAIAGNSVGGNLTMATALMAKEKGGPDIRFLYLMWPVTDSDFETASYNEFSERHFLTKGMMKWFWDSYLPDAAKRKEPTASPLRASLQQLQGLPPVLIQVAENDVLRDEGEALGRKLDEAGVEVTLTRYDGLIHDFGLLNPLARVPGVRSAMLQGGQELKRRLF
jgi:acetyl esterase/lipase